MNLKEFDNDYEQLCSKPGQETTYSTYTKQYEEETNHVDTEICTPKNDYENARRKLGDETPYSTYMNQDEENTEDVNTEIVAPKNEYEKLHRTFEEDQSYSSYTIQAEGNTKGVNTKIDTKILKNNYETLRRKPGEETPYSINTKRNEENNKNEITMIGTSMDDYEKIRRKSGEEIPYSTYTKPDEENTKGNNIEINVPKNDYEKVRRKPGEETPYSTYTKQGEEDTINLYTEICIPRFDNSSSASEKNGPTPLVPAQLSCNRKKTGLIAAISVGLIAIISVSIVVVIRNGTDNNVLPSETPPPTTRPVTSTTTTLANSSTITLPSVANTDLVEYIRLRQRAWYPFSEYEGYRVCFMKVRILFEDGLSLSSGQYIKLKATSYGGTNEEIENIILGFREYNIMNATEDTSFCIEYKCSGTIESLFSPQFDYTRVVLTLVYPTSEMECSVTEEADFVSSDKTSQNEAQIGSTNCTYEIYVPASYSPSIGLYSATTDTLDIDRAYTSAEAECLSGELYNLNDINPDIGVAVAFTFTSK